MALSEPILLWVALGVAALAVGVGVVWGTWASRRERRPSGAPVSRAERVRALPAFAAAVRRRQLALSGTLVLGVLAALLGGVIAARPVEARTIQPENVNRDVMLCLDVSGSMSDVVVEVLGVFEELLPGFQGERIGLTIFNSSSVQVFPLTDDYTFIEDHLRSMRESFDFVDDVPEHWTGTLNGPGASLIGDGLASCAMRFDHADSERARSIILATDNEENGASIVTLEEAAAYTAGKGIRLYTLNPVDGIKADESTRLSDAAASTGGTGYSLRDTNSVGDIVAQVQKQEAAKLRGAAQIVSTDVPQPWIAALIVVALGFVVLLWRVRL